MYVRNHVPVREIFSNEGYLFFPEFFKKKITQGFFF